jgi:glycerate dehydrogenase
MSATGLHSAAFLDLSTFGHADLDLSGLEQSVDRWQWFELINDDELASVLGSVEVLVSNKVFLGREHFEQAKQLKLICIAATGTNNVDLEAAADHGIDVCNVRSYATPSVVQHVFALLLSLTTHYDEYTRDVKAGEWSRSQRFCLLDYPVRELAGKTIGIVGYGELGKAVAAIAQAFGMQMLIAKRNTQDNRPGRLDLHALLPRVDVLSLHCPLNDDTRGMIGADQLALMKNDAVLINTARGGLVDEAALVSALLNGKLGGAGLDVIEQEPPPENYPTLQVDLPNLVVTPHIAWISRESRQRLLDEIVLNIEAFKSGEVRNRV